MKTLIKNAILLDMVGETPNIRKTDILVNDKIIEKIESKIDENADEVVILKEDSSSQEDEEAYVSVEDEDTLNKIFEIFKDKFKEEFNFIDD